MPRYLITFPNGRKKPERLRVWAERACDAIEEARKLRPDLAGRWLDVCRVRELGERPCQKSAAYQMFSVARKEK